MAVITPTKLDPQGIYPEYVWEGITEGDTSEVVEWPGGEGFFEVTGTFGGGSITVNFGLTPTATYIVDDAQAPQGGLFIEPSMAKFDLPKGYIKPGNTGGTGKDVDVRIHPARIER